MAIRRKQTVRKRRSQKRAAAPKLALPTETKGMEEDFSRYIVMYYGREGIGKTSAGASHPRALFFAFEPGTKSLDVFDFFHQNGVVPTWQAFRAGVDLLCKQPKSKRQFDTAIIDTADRGYDLCADWICMTRGIAHVSEDTKGKSDRSGKGWTALKREFTDQLYRLSQNGYGLVLISHSKTREIESSSGQQKYDTIVPTMSGQAFGVARAITDFIFYVEFVRTNSGQSQRILITEGDELIVAKHRGDMPKYLPFPNPTTEEEGPYDIIVRAFHGDHPGLDPSTFTTGKATSKVGRTSIGRERLKAKRDAVKKPRRTVAKKPLRRRKAKIERR